MLGIGTFIIYYILYIYINGLLFSEEFQMTNFTDDCSPYDFSLNIDKVIHKLEIQSTWVIKFVTLNYLKPNPDKWHLILSEKGSTNFVNINGKYIFNSETTN